MSEMIDTIVSVAKFADTKADLSATFTSVLFKKGTVRACSYEGGAAAKIEADGIEALVPAAKLLKVCKALPNAEVAITEPTEKKQQPRLQLRQGSSVAHIDLLPPKQAPKMPTPAKRAKWSEVEGLHQLERVAWCVSQDTTRRHLAGVHLGKFGMAATNGHAGVMLGTPGDLTPELGDDGAIVPPAMLKGLPETVQIHRNGRQLFFAEDPTSGEFRVANCYEAVFPSLDQVMGGVWKSPFMDVPREPLLDMLKSAKLADKDLVLAVEGQRLRVVVDRADTGMSLFDFEGTVSFEHGSKKNKVPAGRIAFGVHLVLPAVQQTQSDTIQLFMNPAPEGSVEPLGIVDGSYKTVIMPVRIN